MKKKNGFVLPEFLVIAAVILISIAVTLNIFVAFNKNYKVIIGYLSSYLKGREIIDTISKDCRVATRVMDDYAGYTTTDDCLVLKVPSIDASRNIIDVNNEFDYIIYRIEDDDIWRVVIPGANSSRPAYDDIFRKFMKSLYITSDEVPLSGIVHKSVITNLTLRVSIAETVLGQEYQVDPGTTVKLMNYEWEFVR